MQGGHAAFFKGPIPIGEIILPIQENMKNINKSRPIHIIVEQMKKKLTNSRPIPLEAPWTMETPPSNFTVEEEEEKEVLGYIDRISLKEGDMTAMNALGYNLWPLLCSATLLLLATIHWKKKKNPCLLLNHNK